MNLIILHFYFQVTKCSYFEMVPKKGSLKASFKGSAALRGYNLEWRHGGQRKWAKVKSLFCAIASVTILKVLCTLCHTKKPQILWVDVICRNLIISENISFILIVFEQEIQIIVFFSLLAVQHMDIEVLFLNKSFVIWNTNSNLRLMNGQEFEVDLG